MIGIVLTGLGILLCVWLSGTFSASEIAYNSCNEVRMENEAKDGNKKASLVLKILEKAENALSAILIGNNLVNIAASSLTSVFMLLLMLRSSSSARPSRRSQQKRTRTLPPCGTPASSMP